MSDLRERFQELADVAARHGRTHGPQAALRRARRRRLRRATWTAALLAMVVLAVTVGVDRLTGPAPLAPTATTTASTIPPDASVIPDPGEVRRPAGSPPGRIGEQMVQDVASAVGAACQGGAPEGPTVLVAWEKAHGRTWLIAAKPPLRGENWLCWASGLFDAGGAGSVGSKGNVPLTPLQASGSQNLRSGNQYWGQIVGTVTKRAARVRVLFDSGIPPLELEPIQAGDRFPVNFYAGFYRQLAEDKRPATWQVIRVVAYNTAGRKVAECQAKGGPGHSC
jgi:hypothetical protein